MKYERFKEIWNTLITNNPSVPKVTNFKMTPTMEALIAYGQGDKSKIQRIQRLLGR